MTRVLVVDNYDSFVFTIVGYLEQLGAECEVVRNDAVAPADAADFDGVLVSPGPGTPEEAGVSMAMIEGCAERAQPMLGVCLGHQALGV
ncbi:MAG TPA: aminodeoxychorismate/anthranilate synthase component II, partial [Ornithinibacter sp.]|nr:aminodeoxychorismate/anthranilate synthase component II [Ornithinibacter sp.]